MQADHITHYTNICINRDAIEDMLYNIYAYLNNLTSESLCRGRKATKSRLSECLQLLFLWSKRKILLLNQPKWYLGTQWADSEIVAAKFYGHHGGRGVLWRYNNRIPYNHNLEEQAGRKFACYHSIHTNRVLLQ